MRLERFRRIRRLVRRRIVEQLERRQLAGLRRLEQRHLPLLLDALALLDDRRAAPRCAACTRVATFFCFDLRGFDARLLALRRRPRRRARCCGARLNQPMPFQMPAPMRSMIVSQETPNASDTPAIHAASSNSVAPRKFRPAGEPAADELPDDAARGLRAACPDPSAASRGRSSRSACSAKPPMRTAVLTRVRPSSSVALAEHHPAGDAQHDGKQEGRPAEQEEQDVATARRRPARCGCRPRVAAARGGERRDLRGCTTRSANEHDQRDDADGEHRALAQARATRPP